MNKIHHYFLTICLSAGSFLNAQEEPSDAWLGHWMDSIEYSQEPRSYPKAVETYTTAILALTPSQISAQLNLVNERAEIYFKMQDYQNAIKDFSFVINQPHANQEQKIAALWGRSKAYLASGKFQEFEKDSNQLQQLEDFITPIEETKEYAILKVSPYALQDAESQERLVNMLMKRKEIKSRRDITFTPSGLVIVRKAKQDK